MLVFAATTAVFYDNGRRVGLRAGEAWDADDPFVASHPELFTDEPVTGIRRTVEQVEERPVEQVETAAKRPGGKRAKANK